MAGARVLSARRTPSPAATHPRLLGRALPGAGPRGGKGAKLRLHGLASTLAAGKARRQSATTPATTAETWRTHRWRIFGAQLALHGARRGSFFGWCVQIFVSGTLGLCAPRPSLTASSWHYGRRAAGGAGAERGVGQGQNGASSGAVSGPATTAGRADARSVRVPCRARSSSAPGVVAGASLRAVIQVKTQPWRRGVRALAPRCARRARCAWAPARESLERLRVNGKLTR